MKTKSTLAIPRYFFPPPYLPDRTPKTQEPKEARLSEPTYHQEAYQAQCERPPKPCRPYQCQCCQYQTRHQPLPGTCQRHPEPDQSDEDEPASGKELKSDAGTTQWKTRLCLINRKDLSRTFQKYKQSKRMGKRVNRSKLTG